MPRTLIATIENPQFPNQLTFESANLQGTGNVNAISVHNYQAWTLNSIDGPAGYRLVSRESGILPYGKPARSLTSLPNGRLEEPPILPDNFIGYEIELLNNDVVVATEQSSSIETSFSTAYINGTAERLYFGRNGFTAYNVGNITASGIVLSSAYLSFPTTTGFDEVRLYLVTDNDGSDIYANALNVVDGVLILDRHNAEPLEVRLPILSGTVGDIPELQPYIYSSVSDLEFLVGDLVTGRKFKDYIPRRGEVEEQLATNPSRAHAVQALQIGAASTLNDMSPSIPKTVDALSPDAPVDIVVKQGLRWCNAYGGAVVLMNTFSKEGMPVQSRDSRTRINTLLLMYRTWIEKTIRSVTGWPISITPKASVFGIGRDFPRSIQRGDQGGGQFGRPRRGTNTIGVIE